MCSPANVLGPSPEWSTRKGGLAAVVGVHDVTLSVFAVAADAAGDADERSGADRAEHAASTPPRGRGSVCHYRHKGPRRKTTTVERHEATNSNARGARSFDSRTRLPIVSVHPDGDVDTDGRLPSPPFALGRSRSRGRRRPRRSRRPLRRRRGLGAETTEPVLFHDTVTTGVVPENAGDDDELSEVDVPKAQVFYSQYEYVVGYRGVERFVDAHGAPGHEERFGYPLTVYVTDYGASGGDVRLTEDGYPTSRARPQTGSTPNRRCSSSTARPERPQARRPSPSAIARTQTRSPPTTVGPSSAGRACSNASSRSTTLTWSGTASTSATPTPTTWSRATPMRDRPVEVVVGEDAATLEEAVETAPAESTVVVPEGVHEVPEEVAVDRPITIVGQGQGERHGNGDDGTEAATDATTLRGDGNGSVLVLESERAAVTDLRIDGVGDVTSPDDDEQDGDDVLEMAYGQSDAGIELDEAPGALVENVTIESPATGVLLRDAPESVVRNVTVEGSDDWGDGYMAVTTIRSPDAVVEDSTLVDGRDGIYLHRSDGVVFRDNVLENNRIGVHLMYTSRTLIADNRIEDPVSTGIDVMTAPEHNAIVGNEIRNGSQEFSWPDRARTSPTTSSRTRRSA